MLFPVLDTKWFFGVKQCIMSYSQEGIHFRLCNCYSRASAPEHVHCLVSEARESYFNKQHIQP